MTGWLAGRWNMGKLVLNFKFLQFVMDQFFNFLLFNKVTALLEQCEYIYVGIFGKNLF